MPSGRTSIITYSSAFFSCIKSFAPPHNSTARMSTPIPNSACTRLRISMLQDRVGDQVHKIDPAIVPDNRPPLIAYTVIDRESNPCESYFFVVSNALPVRVSHQQVTTGCFGSLVHPIEITSDVHDHVANICKCCSQVSGGR